MNPVVAARLLKIWAAVGRETFRHKPLAAPLIVLKSLVGYAAYRIRPDDFFELGLQDQPLGTGREYIKFHPELLPGLTTLNMQGAGLRIADDKVITAERLHEAGIPQPPIVAVVGRIEDNFPHGHVFPAPSTVAEIVATLATAPDRLVAKPAGGMQGKDIYGPTREGEGWQVDDRFYAAEQMAARLLADAPPIGMLLQSRLRSHPGMAPIGGELGLGTIRIGTALTTSGPEVIFTWLKIIGGANLVDNFAGGSSGNLVATLNKNGEIVRAYCRRGGKRFLLDDAIRHPVTGAKLIGFRIPLWEDTMALARRLSATIPENPLIGSDVAVTENGPTIIETNYNWNVNATQLLCGGGIRPLLRDVVPRLAADDAVKTRAARQMGLY